MFLICGINRNIVECKGWYTIRTSQFPAVLIETLWNVKKSPFQSCPGIFYVLIETLWNVKLFSYLLSGCHLSINRNIVECKDINIKGICQRISGINRNIVECKVYYTEYTDNDNYCINRNIVECKDNIPVNDKPPVHGINRNIVECKVERKIELLNRDASINRNIVECKVCIYSVSSYANQY